MKGSTNQESAAPRPALIFIPDISGFTRFVTETEIDHARHIIEELLEILIDANKTGLEVSEIEGDAILFYRFGKAPESKELLDQVREMFNRFHTHLKNYETHRVCNCGACCTAHTLAIKFIAHYGDVAINTIRQYKKLFGKEVIVAHRLLKNDIDSREYSLFTQNLLEASPSWASLAGYSWSEVNQGEEAYDSGRIAFHYISLEPLLSQVPPPMNEDYNIQGKRSMVLETQFIIEAPFELVFNVIADVPWRSKWLPDVLEEFTDINSALTQSGQTHKCIAKGPIMVGHDYQVTSDTVRFTETPKTKTHSTVYTLRRIDARNSELTCGIFIGRNFLKEVMFNILMKNKIKKSCYLAWNNLNNYCKELVSKGEDHPYRIQLAKQNKEAIT